jgi:hypothetical protein
MSLLQASNFRVTVRPQKTGRLGFVQADGETLHLPDYCRPHGEITPRVTSSGLLR